MIIKVFTRQYILVSILVIVCCIMNVNKSRATEIFPPGFGDMLNVASQFSQAYTDYSAAAACAADPQCGMPDNPNSGFEIPTGDCCDGISECVSSFDSYIGKLDDALKILYGNERYYDILMRVQKARMTAMKGAGAMSAPGSAVVARMEVDIAKAQKGFIDKFNAKTENNIKQLNKILMKLGGIVDQYCSDSNWYQRNGLPLYLHAKTKFPK